MELEYEEDSSNLSDVGSLADNDEVSFYLSGLTPLHQAVLDGNIAVTKLLISHGADVNKQDEDYWTPLHAACAEGHSDIVTYLLSNGADRQILTDNGERPLDLVEPTDFLTIKAMLEDVAASCSQTENSDQEDDDDDNDDDDDDDEGGGNRGRRQNYGEDNDDDEHDDDDGHNDHGDHDDDDDDDDDSNRGGKDSIHRNARLFEDDVMGDLEYVSPEEEDEEEEENRRRRRLRQSERSRSGSKSTSEQEVHYRSEEDRLDVEDSECEQQLPRQKHEQVYGSQGEEEISDEEQFELQENYYQQNPNLSYDIENENCEYDEPPRESEENLSDRSDHECRQRCQRHYIDGVSDDDRKGRSYYDIEGEESDDLNRQHRHLEHEDPHQCDSGEERYYREISKDANNNSNSEDSRARQYEHRQCSSEFRGDSTEKELSNISENSENEHLHLPKPGEISADEITA